MSRRLAAGAIVALAIGVAPASASEEVSWRVSKLPAASGGHPASYGEPGIAAGPDGRLIVNAARANAGYPTWWFSSDDGTHWGRGRDLDRSGAMTGDADAAIGPDGYLYVLNLAFNSPPQQPANPTVLVYSSRDWRHFRGPASFPPPHGADQPDRPWLVPDPNHPGRVYVTNSEGAGDVVVWTSTDHGYTFRGPTLVTGAQHAGSIELTSRPLFDRRRIVIVYEASKPSQPSVAQPLADFPLTQLWEAESNDLGRTWGNHLILDIGSGSLGHVLPAAAVGTDGTMYVAFSLRNGGGTQTHIFVMHSTGPRWSKPIRVDRGKLGSNVMPALAAGARGRIDIAWYASASTGFTNPHSRWVETFAQSVDALNKRPSFRRSELSGVTHIGSVDSSGNPGSSQYDWGLRDFQSIVVDACGMAHVAWTNDRRQATLVARQLSGPSLRSRGHC